MVVAGIPMYSPMEYVVSVPAEPVLTPTTVISNSVVSPEGKAIAPEGATPYSVTEV